MRKMRVECKLLPPEKEVYAIKIKSTIPQHDQYFFERCGLIDHEFLDIRKFPSVVMDEINGNLSKWVIIRTQDFNNSVLFTIKEGLDETKTLAKIQAEVQSVLSHWNVLSLEAISPIFSSDVGSWRTLWISYLWPIGNNPGCLAGELLGYMLWVKADREILSSVKNVILEMVRDAIPTM